MILKQTNIFNYKRKDLRMLNLAIGIEKEFDNLDIMTLRNEIRNNYPHLDYLRIIGDGSLRNGGEVVFPPLSFKAESTWSINSQVNDIIISLGGRITTQCGQHVHIGLKPITMDSEEFNLESIRLFRQHKYFQDSTDHLQFEVIKDVCFRYAKYQSDINKLVSRSRRGSRYCYEINNRLSQIESSTNISQLKNSISGKFNAINLTNIQLAPNGKIQGKGTIEFRQHQGTLSTEKLKNWIEFLVNLIDYSKNYRFTLVDQGTRYMETLTNTMPYNTKLYRVFEMIQTDEGATTREIMTQCGINDARSVRRTINTIRRKLGSTQSVITLNQEYYGHLNGTSNQQYDLNGYKIPQQIERISQGSIQLNDNDDCIWSNLRQDLKQWFHDRITRLS